MKIKIESLFISDCHLGNRNAQADKLLEIFKKYEFNNLFIVGDFLDLTNLKKRFYWEDSHSKVIQKVLKYSRECNTYYLVGNHDYYIRDLIKEQNINLGNILICNEYIYTSLRGEKIYLVHGDCFDGFVATHKLLYVIGDFAYEFSIKINKIYNMVRKLIGLDYWSFSSYMKRKVKNIIKFLSEYKKASKRLVIEKGCDSLLMGHTHSPEIISGEYYNSGDFVESCSYIVENTDGSIELLFCK